jgi:hypothetical protein
MRILLKAVRFVLSVVVFVCAVNLAYALAVAYAVASGRFRPGETIEFLEAPAPELGEVTIKALAWLALVAVAAFARWRLTRWSSPAPQDESSKPNVE